MKTVFKSEAEFEEFESELESEFEGEELKEMENELLKLQDQFEEEVDSELKDMESEFLKEFHQIKSEFLQIESDLKQKTKVTEVTGVIEKSMESKGTNSNQLNKRPKAPLVKEKQTSLFKQRK